MSRQTVYKWVRRHRVEGPAGLADRSSRPHAAVRFITRAGLPRLADVDRLTGQLLLQGRRHRTAATNTIGPAICCTCTSRSSAGSRTVVDGGPPP
jgi:transposase-like protein